MQLIIDSEERGYPIEYILARIKARRSMFISNWDEIVFSPDPVGSLLTGRRGEFLEVDSYDSAWIGLLKEFQWIYLQMDRVTGQVFRPFFTYCEIQTIFTCLRYRAGRGNDKEVEDILRYSLLDNSVKKRIMNSQDMGGVTAAIEKKLLSRRRKGRRILDIPTDNGTAELEHELMVRFFDYVMSSNIHEMIRGFFAFLADLKNILAVCKCLKWKIDLPELVQGGYLRESRLKSIFEAEGVADLKSLTLQSGGKVNDISDLPGMEKSLYTSLTKRVHKGAKENGELEVILDYLWRAYTEARNMSVVIRGSNIERDRVREELIEV